MTQAPGADGPAEGAEPLVTPVEAVLGVQAPPAATREGRGWDYLARLETSTLVLLPRGGVGEQVGYAQLSPPLLLLDGGEEFGVNVGAFVRLRLWGGEASAGWVREEDWDSLSDWGQLVHALNLGLDNAPVGGCGGGRPTSKCRGCSPGGCTSSASWWSCWRQTRPCLGLSAVFSGTSSSFSHRTTPARGP